MKRKLLLCVLVLVLCLSVFAACEQKLDNETLETMIEIIKVNNKDKSTVTNADYTLPALVAYGDTSCHVKWTVSVSEGVTVSDPDEEGFVTITVNWETPTDINYTLTATLVNGKGVAYKDADGKDYAISFERKVPAFVVTDYAGYKANCESSDKNKPTINIKAYVIAGIIPSSKSSSLGSLYLQDKDGHGYYAYAPTLADSVKANDEAFLKEFPFGAEVYVSGTGTVYSGQYEFNKGCAIRKTGRTASVAELPYEDVTAKFGAATNNKDKALIPYQNKLVEIKGAELVSIDESYYYFTVNGVQFNMYKNNYFMTDAEATTLYNKFEVGKKADIKGLVSVYSSAYQIYAVGADGIANVQTITRTDEQKAELDGANIKLTPTTITKVDDKITLPAKGSVYESTITWALKEGSTFGTIADGKYSITELPKADTKVTLVATIKCGTATITKEFEITIKEQQPANGVKLTDSNMGLGNYADGTAKVNNIDFGYTELGSYKNDDGTTNGIQMRQKNGNIGSLWNTTAFAKKITAVKITCPSSKVGYSNENFLKIEFANNKDFTDAKTVMLSTVANQAEYDVEVPAGDYTFIRITVNLTYTFYIDSLLITTAA